VFVAGPLLHVVLHEPEIPPNTGNIGRTCVAVGAKLWLVRPLGFRLDEKHLKRAGMDYWPHLDWEAVDDWSCLLARLGSEPGDRRFWFVECGGSKSIWEAQFQLGDVLVFGSESRGLPAGLLAGREQQIVSLPMRSVVRSLNLASTANTVIYEAVRQFGGRVAEG
jgi:tRNA (cytidine/uridine-2'-O-)-methyltransferase